MEIPKILPQFTEAKVSKSGFLNGEDLIRLGKNFLIYLTPAITLYAVQLTGALNAHVSLSVKDIWPSAFVIGALEAHVIATVLDYIRKLNDPHN